MDEGLIRTVMALYTVVRTYAALRESIPSELLYGDDLVPMTPIMEPFGRCVAEWRVSLLDKGLNVNAVSSGRIYISSVYNPFSEVVGLTLC